MCSYSTLCTNLFRAETEAKEHLLKNQPARRRFFLSAGEEATACFRVGLEALLRYLRGIHIPSKLERGTESVRFKSHLRHLRKIAFAQADFSTSAGGGT